MKEVKKVNILDLFSEKNKKQRSDGNWQIECPDCGLQGGRTEGFIIFTENNTCYCHSSGKHFNYLETYALKKKIIRCLDGKESGEKGSVLDGEQFREVLDLLKEEYGEEKYKEILESLGLIDVDKFLIIEIGKKGSIEKKVNIDKVAKYIEHKFNIRTIYGLREELIEVYEDGIWSAKGRGIIKGEIENLLGVYAKNNIVNEILEKIKRRTEVAKEDTEIIPEFKRCLKNGVLDLEDINNLKLLPHSKEYNFKSKFPIDYKPEAKCPNIQKFIEETFYEEDIPKVQEWFGLHLPRRYVFKKASIFHGPKNTGKTVFLNLLTAYVGSNVSGLSLQEISRGKPFDLLALKDKDANICDDLSSADMKAIGGFKMAVGDGYISAEMKFGDKCRFRNTAKDTNACNKIPSPGEDIDDDAYYERILLFPLDNVIEKDKMDKHLIDKLTTEEELSGLLNWAIEGYIRLIKRNKFSNDKTPEETKFLMVQNGNSLAKFATEVIIQADGEKIDKESMYRAYCNWCLKHKPQLSPDTKEKIGRNLTKFAPYTQASSDGKERYWLNVRFNDTYDTLQNNMRVFLEEGNTSSNRIYNFSESVISVSDKTTENTVIKHEKDIKKSDREVQFYEAEECKDIICKTTKEEILNYIKEKNNITWKDLDNIFGIGSLKLKNQLIREGKIKQEGDILCLS